jgi:hypothetical protein
MSKSASWSNGIEPSLDELLSDPVIITLMERDGVTRHDVEAIIDRATASQSHAIACIHQ